MATQGSEKGPLNAIPRARGMRRRKADAVQSMQARCCCARAVVSLAARHSSRAVYPANGLDRGLALIKVDTGLRRESETLQLLHVLDDHDRRCAVDRGWRKMPIPAWLRAAPSIKSGFPTVAGIIDDSALFLELSKRKSLTQQIAELGPVRHGCFVEPVKVHCGVPVSRYSKVAALTLGAFQRAILPVSASERDAERTILPPSRQIHSKTLCPEYRTARRYSACRRNKRNLCRDKFRHCHRGISAPRSAVELHRR
jgi:hypothetical protein